MSMLQKLGSGDRTQTTLAEYDYEIPNTEPTDTRTGQKGGQHYDKPYTNWKAKYYSTARERNLGAGSTASAGSQKSDGTSVVADTTNKWFNVLAMLRYRKILKRYAKRGNTALAA